MILLVMFWMVRHCWPAVLRFEFNCYRHWVQLLLRQSGDAPVIILSQEVVTQGDSLSMVIYGITLVPLVEDLRNADPTLISSFYANDAAFEGLERRGTAQLKLLIYRWGGYGLLT